MGNILDQQDRATRQWSSMDDAELLGRSRHASAAFSELVRRHADGLFKYAAIRVGPDAAQDVVAETFSDGFDRQDRFDPRRGDVRGWLFGIAAIQLRRHAERERRWLQRAAAATGHARLDDADEQELRAVERVDASRLAPELASALLSLSPAERDVLLLYALEEMSHEQIARTLGIRRGAAKTRLSRGRARLREQLTPTIAANDLERSEP